MALYDHF